jgi:hypothetical protein
MRRRNRASWLMVLGLGLAAIAADTAAAQDTAPTAPRKRPHVTVHPLDRYYRKCDFWLAVEHRPSGDVITPQQHCVWALR